MTKVQITKDIYVRDEYGVRRRAFVAGELVELHHYNAVVRTNMVVNPEDLLTSGKPATFQSLAHTVVTKELPVEAPVVTEQATEEVVAEPVEEETEVEVEPTASDEVVKETVTKIKKAKK